MTFWTELAKEEFELGYVNANGIRTRSLRSGSGDAVVFLHGTSGHLEAFIRNIPAHSEHFACHAIDMLGHGYTDKPDYPYRIARYVEHLLAYLDAGGIERAHLVGESLGGWVAGRLAADHPERVKRLTLVAPGGTVANPKVMERIKSSTRAAVESGDVELTRKRLELLMYDPAKDVSDELVETRHGIYTEKAFVERIDNLLSLQELEARQEDLLSTEQMESIDAPTMIIWGRQNPFGEVPEAERMHSCISGSTLELFDDCGHWPQHEHAERFNELNIAFLLGQ